MGEGTGTSRDLAINEALRRSEAQYTSLFRVLSSGVVITNDAGQIIDANPAAERILGLTRSETVERTFDSPSWILIRPDGTPMPAHEYASVRALRESRTIDDVEMGILRPDGTVRWLLTSASPVPVEGLGVSITFTDITERKEAEKALQESELRWRFAIEGAGDGLWDWNVPTSKVFFSRRWKEMLGFSESEIGDGLDEWSKRVHPDDLTQVMADVQAHLDGSTPLYSNEHRVRCKDGSWKWILDRGLVVSRSPDGMAERVVGTHSDVTGRRRTEEQMRLASLVFESTSEAIVVTDARGIIISVNQRFLS